MLPTTIQARNVLNAELSNHGICTLHSYTDKARVKGDTTRRYITYIVSKRIKLKTIEEIVKECNQTLPSGKFRMTPPVAAIGDRYPCDNIYIRVTARMKK